MKPEGSPIEDGSAKEQIASEAVEVIKREVTAGITEQKAADTVYDLLKIEWLFDSIVDRAMTALEAAGITVSDEHLAEVVATTIAGLLPEGSPPNPTPEQIDAGGDSDAPTGVREPRRPLPNTDSGSIELDIPRAA